jgi:hypothetical protein
MRWYKLSSELYNAGAVVRPRKTLDVLRAVSPSAAEPTYSAMIIRRPTSWTESRRDLPRKLTLESSWSRSPTQSHPDAVLGGNPIGELERHHPHYTVQRFRQVVPAPMWRAAVGIGGRHCRLHVCVLQGLRNRVGRDTGRGGIVTRDLSEGGVVADVPRDRRGYPSWTRHCESRSR